MAHTSRMDGSDKCSHSRHFWMEIGKDFFHSITGRYVDITFKATGLVALLLGLFVLLPLFSYLYVYHGNQLTRNVALVVVPGVLVTYVLAYIWIFARVYRPLHETSSRLLADQEALDAWPEEGEYEGEDLVLWGQAELTKILNQVRELRERADRIADGKLGVETILDRRSRGFSLSKAVKFDLDDGEEKGEMFRAFNDMTKSMRRLACQAHRISEGNLDSNDLEIRVEGELGEATWKMIENLETFVQSVNESVNETKRVVSELITASEELREASQALSRGVQEQSTSLSKTSSAIEEMASMLDQTSDNTGECSRLSEEALTSARNGEEKINELAETMEKINEDSERISEAVELIDDIAFQTNLLALNAAVEAANAGEHGDGFAVVADEVRKLAQRSSDAAAEIEEVIEESNERTDKGVEIARVSRDAVVDIKDNFQKVRERIEEVDAASNEQSSGIEEINRSITEFEDINKKNSSSAQQTAASSEELERQAESLEDVVDKLADSAGQYTVS